MKSGLAAFAAFVGVAACATPYTPIPYDREAAKVVHLDVVDQKLPEQATTRKLATNGENMASAMAASAGLAGVLVGAVAAGIEANIEAGQRNRMLAVLDSVDFDGQAIFDAALEDSLEENGYSLGTIRSARKSTAVLVEAPIADETLTNHAMSPGLDTATSSWVVPRSGAPLWSFPCV